MNTPILSQAAAIGAMGFALTVALVDHPREEKVRVSAERSPSAATWSAAIEAGADHITATDLSERLLSDPTSVLLVDVRPASEFATFHLPGAVNLDLTELLGARGEALLAAHANQWIVLCSNGMTHPAQAWVELTRRGLTQVRVLEDGLDGFVRDVLTPPSLREATTEARAEREAVAFTKAAAAFLARPPESERIELTNAASNSDGTAHGASTQTSTAHGTTAQKPDEKPVADKTPVADKKVDTVAIEHLATDPAALTKPTIVSTAWVAKRGAGIVLLDAREKPEDFAAGHLPGARHVPLKMLREERDGVPDQLLAPDKLAALLGPLGIDVETEVVAYGDVKLQDPAHLALALISAGHQKIAILEGGYLAWKAEGRALSVEAPVCTAKTYVPRAAPGFRSVALDDVKKASATSSARILDVRPADAFRGDISTEARAGHIPRAMNRPYTADVATTASGLYWRPLDDLRHEYDALGLSRQKPVIVSCRTGHQAAQTWFTLRYLLGYEDVSWYDGSWKEWAARPELPVEIGPAAK